MTPFQLFATAAGVNLGWLGVVTCLMQRTDAGAADKDVWLVGAGACGIAFLFLLHRLSGRGLMRALGLVLLALAVCVFAWICFLHIGAMGTGDTEYTINGSHVWPAIIVASWALGCYEGIRRAAEDDEPEPVTRSWFGRRQVTSPNWLEDCPCEDGQIITQQRVAIEQLKEVCARQNAELAHMRKAIEAGRNNRTGQLEYDVEEILTLPGVKERLRSLIHPDHHPNASAAEQRRFKEGFQKLSALYKRLGR